MASQNLSPQSPVPQKTSRSPTLPEGEQRLLDDTSLAEENLLSSDNLLSADSLLSTDDLLGAASADDLLLPAGGEPSPQNLSPRNLSPRNLSPEQPLPSPSLERLIDALGLHKESVLVPQCDIRFDFRLHLIETQQKGTCNFCRRDLAASKLFLKFFECKLKKRH